MKYFCLFVLIVFITIPAAAENYRVLESNSEYIKIEFDFENSFLVKDTLIDGNTFSYISGKSQGVRKPGDPWLPGEVVNLGIPANSNPRIIILNIEKNNFSNKFIIPFPENDPSFTKLSASNLNSGIYSSNKFFPGMPAQFNKPYIMRFAKVISLEISPFQFNPVTRQLIFNKKIILQINYNNKGPAIRNIEDKVTEDFLKNSVMNYDQAVNWIWKPEQSLKKTTAYWYDPSKDYYKIFLKGKGVYRLTFEQLVSAGIPISAGVSSSKLAILNNGEKVPIDIHDGGDDIFNSGDYIQFVGYPPKPSPYVTQNIYNIDNVYWFTYQNDAVPDTFKTIDGFPHSVNKLIDNTFTTIHYEKDSLYERLGYAPDGNRDFWFWGAADGSNGVPSDIFSVPFSKMQNLNPDSTRITIRAALYGLTTSGPYPDHLAKIFINNQFIGTKSWGLNAYQTGAVFDSTYSSGLQILPQNTFKVSVDGASINSSDVIRINWFEIGYWRQLIADTNHLSFESTKGISGLSTYKVSGWQSDSMIVYIPQRGEKISNPNFLNNSGKEVEFNDNISEQTEYFCVSENYFLSPDSITKDLSSDLRNTANGADYLIITHPKFTEAANQLAQFRSQHLEGYANPRIKVVDVRDIYDEFSYGLLDPYAIKDFIKYTFENWNGAPPHYVVLLGDMSYDYRHLLSTSRLNYIPSIPYQQQRYGQAVSDNNFVAVSGNDVFPDMAIGRLSCETMSEANILVDKIINYPADNGKEWKQNVLLIGGGQDQADEDYYHFNNEELYLQNSLIVPHGYTTSKVFRYPADPEQIPFKGEGPDIRRKIDDGCAIVNFYGHGGGYQWDLVFLNDDIYQLNNGGKLPMIFSVTCYTAHFDNQDVFGEQFNKVPGRGSIGFWGHTGLTFWDYGLQLNNFVYDQIFNKKKFVVGDAILDAKSPALSDSSNNFVQDHVALLTLLGDPALELALPKKPDFSVKPSDIVLNPQFPVSGQNLNIKLRLHNLGTTFPNDSVNVKVTVSSSDSSFVLKNLFIPNFGEDDSISFNWLPTLKGQITLRLDINSDNRIAEDDHSDNSAAQSFYIFNLGQPDIVYPIDGFSTNKSNLDFLFSDIGEYVNQKVSYSIQIDTSLNFNSPQLISAELIPENGTAKWQSPQLPAGYYFWRARTNDNQGNSGSWSDVRNFSILQGSNINGYYMENKLLKSLVSSNINYSGTSNSLELNKNVLPPRPADDKFLEDINLNFSVLDTVNLSCITTDGTYIYFANIADYAASYNQTGNSQIYKIGTGFNGTTKGQFYGAVPNFYSRVLHQFFYYTDGFIYVPFGMKDKLLKVSSETGIVDTVEIPGGMLKENMTGGDAFDLATDGKYVYNLSIIDSIGEQKYTLRTFDPGNGWQQRGEDLVLSGTSYSGFTNFFVVNGYLYTYEHFESGFMRRFNISTGGFEEEWLTRIPFQGFYGWCYDKTNNLIYASVFFGSYKPKISVYTGNYTDESGIITTPLIGPALKWENLTYQIERTGTTGKSRMSILGLNNGSKSFDTLFTNVPGDFSISGINSSKYEFIKLNFVLSDSSNNPANQIGLKNINLVYKTPPEILIRKSDISLASDSLGYGLTDNVSAKVFNIGKSNADSVSLKFFIDNLNTSIYSASINIPADSSVNVNHDFTTSGLSGGNYHSIKALASLKTPEFFTYNNSAEKRFFIIRDSVNPTLTVAFDGREILNGDVVPYNPDIVITLKDNNPIPLDTSLFSIYLNNNPVYLSGSNVKVSTTPYPDAQMIVDWKPTLPDSQNVLQIFARDASGNLTDSSGLTLIFYVYKNPDLLNVFNYPNPFKNDTYFTFELYGASVPEQFLIKIYTVAGRLIKDISIPSSELRIGYNKIYWDGKDQDGDNIANGVYFYKIISKNGGRSKSVLSKLAKVN